MFTDEDTEAKVPEDFNLDDEFDADLLDSDASSLLLGLDDEDELGGFGIESEDDNY